MAKSGAKAKGATRREPDRTAILRGQFFPKGKHRSEADGVIISALERLPLAELGFDADPRCTLRGFLESLGAWDHARMLIGLIARHEYDTAKLEAQRDYVKSFAKGLDASAEDIRAALIALARARERIEPYREPSGAPMAFPCDRERAARSSWEKAVRLIEQAEGALALAEADGPAAGEELRKAEADYRAQIAEERKGGSRAGRATPAARLVLALEGVILSAAPGADQHRLRAALVAFCMRDRAADSPVGAMSNRVALSLPPRSKEMDKADIAKQIAGALRGLKSAKRRGADRFLADRFLAFSAIFPRLADNLK